jgi:hypothetical protein
MGNWFRSISLSRVAVSLASNSSAIFRTAASVGRFIPIRNPEGAADVAEVIYQAATDGSDRLRCLVGNDTRGFIKARYEMADQVYLMFMRSHFEANE